MSTQREQHTDQVRATLETAIDFGLDEQEILDTMLWVWDRAGVAPEILDDLTAALAARILERERQR